MSKARYFALLSAFFLAACASVPDPVFAPASDVAKHKYRPDGPPEIRLYTVVSTRNGSGAHSSLLITTETERILFDPAGSFALPAVPERYDVLYGITPRVLGVYVDYHARVTYDVVEQRVKVSAGQAESIARMAKAYGPVPRAQCALSINRILRRVAGFESMPLSYFPNASRAAFARVPGVNTRIYSDDDPHLNSDVLLAARAE